MFGSRNMSKPAMLPVRRIMTIHAFKHRSVRSRPVFASLLLSGSTLRAVSALFCAQTHVRLSATFARHNVRSCSHIGTWSELEMETFIGTKEAGIVLGISQTAVCRLIARGSLAAVDRGVWLIKKTEVDRLNTDPGYRARSRRDTNAA